ncbi:MAG: glycosyltransferase family 4 protein [Deltaproteobacteria bacterium]|nr:glycosyltransferase family 4 protein [Candidatus Zymogenaceae bacterium]
MKIAYLVNTFPIHPAVTDQMLSLTGRGHDITVFSIFPLSRPLEECDPVLVRGLVVAAHIRIIRTFLLGLVTTPRFLLRLIKKGRRYIGIKGSIRAFYLAGIIQKKEIDRIHCEFVSVNSLYALILSRELSIPASHTIHGSDLFLKPIAHLRDIIDEARPFITISEYNRTYLEQRYGPISRRVEVVRCGVDPDRLVPNENLRGGIPLRIVAVSWFRPVKSLDTLARSLVILKNRGVPFRAIIIGGGSEGKDAVQSIIDEGGISQNTELTGAVSRDEVLAYLARSDIFALPSISEGVPVAMMEAMAMELPVVATNIMGLSEIVDDGVSGFLVPKQEPDAMADKLELLLRDDQLRLSMGREGRRLIIDGYNIHKNVVRIESLFSDAGNRHRN